MNNETKHTPTPWEVVKENEEPSIYARQVDMTVCDFSPAYENNTENAAFIVRAVNCFEENQAKIARLEHAHEALVEALRSVLSTKDIYMNSALDATGYRKSKFDQARKALALADAS